MGFIGIYNQVGPRLGKVMRLVDTYWTAWNRRHKNSEFSEGSRFKRSRWLVGFLADGCLIFPVRCRVDLFRLSGIGKGQLRSKLNTKGKLP